MNTIALAKQYTPLLDEVYRIASVTEDLVSSSDIVRAGASAEEILYPQIDVSGLGDYDRNSGYTTGSNTVKWVSARFNYDRGAKFNVDSEDDAETFGIAFGQLSGELMRTRVAPEADAFCFATLAGKSGISVGTATTFTNGKDFLDALADAKTRMDEDEVPAEDRILYATSTLLNSVIRLDTTASREILDAFAARRAVPQSRFYTAIDLLDGKTGGEEAGHYKKADDGKDINFMVIHKPAVIKYDKHVVSGIIAPENNPDADAYVVKYRKHGIVDVYANKVAGIYVSHKAS